MVTTFIAKATTQINVPISNVWDALVSPDIIKQYMFGTNVVSDWKEGSKIVWKGEWQGKAYEDKGVILKLIPEQLIQYTHFSPMSGLSDVQENYHMVTIDLTAQEGSVLVSLSQDNNATREAKEHSEKNWGMMLTSLKTLLEK